MIFIDNYTPVLYLCKPKIFDHIILYSIFKESTRMSLVKCKKSTDGFYGLVVALVLFNVRQRRIVNSKIII